MSDEAIEAARRYLKNADLSIDQLLDLRPTDRERIRSICRALLAREAERDAVIEECAKAADRVVANCDLTFDEEEVGHRISERIRALKTAGQPPADGGKEGE